MHLPKKVISGGQSGADIGGLIGASRAGIETGGCAPKGFKTENGSQENQLKQFGLIAHVSANYKDRTKQNVQTSDATLIIATEPGSDGTQLTIDYCEKSHKPFVVINPDQDNGLEQVKLFLQREKPNILNVAGNRESKSPGIATKTANLLEEVFNA